MGLERWAELGSHPRSVTFELVESEQVPLLLFIL